MTTRTIPIQCPQGANPTGTSLEALIAIVDHNGLDVVLTMIREICYAKANHIAVQDQDVAGAKLWIAYAMRVNSVVQAIK